MKPQYAAFGMPGGAELILIAIVAVFWLTPIVFVVWLVRYLIRSSREKERMKSEIARLADEIAKLRIAHSGASKSERDAR